MAKVAEVTAVVTVAWWLRWYVLGLIIVSAITGLRPDPAKVQYWIRRAVRLKVRPRK